MKDWRKWCKKLLFLPLWPVLLLVVISTVSLVAVFINGWEASPIAYAVYVLSFYTVVVLCIFCGMVFPKIYRGIRQKVYDNKYGNRYMTDVAFKTHVSLYRSFGVNLLYVGMNLFLGVFYKTAWFVVLAVYYVILAVMRFLLIRFVNRIGIGKDLLGELKRSRLCGIILISVNLVLSGAVLMILYQNRGYEYPGILIYVMALYTFYITTLAIVNIVKYQKYKSPVMSTSKVINLTAALVSMLSLETAMLSQFGSMESVENRRIMIAATGGGVSIIILSLSLYIIIRANREIQKLKINNFQT